MKSVIVVTVMFLVVFLVLFMFLGRLVVMMPVKVIGVFMLDSPVGADGAA